MLSILIPNYNYNVVPLVLELQKQCLECKISFEILVFDDGSKQFLEENSSVNTIDNCHFEALDKNIGRSAIRNLLAKKAKFEWLLFTDCDTFPTECNFIMKYISEISKEDKRAFFGGIKYEKEQPESKRLLRWIYGNARETLSVRNRESNPYNTALISNFLIRKDVFSSNPFDTTITKYGYEDLVFVVGLKKKEILIGHIENPTYHLGLETSSAFLKKTKLALENLKTIIDDNILDSSESKLSRTYSFLKRFCITYSIAILFKKFEKRIEYNLLSEKPSLYLFDLYRLGYFCDLNSN